MRKTTGDSPALGVPPEALSAYLALLDAIDAETTSTPCRDNPAAWTAEEGSHREVAAATCLDCPVFVPCGTYADRARERGGVWAGVDRTPRRVRAATPTVRSDAA